ncbi:hypothetical protein JCM5353_003395 [Sporobolomyces roseus]
MFSRTSRALLSGVQATLPLSRTFTTSLHPFSSKPSSPSPSDSSIEVDSLCLPLTSPYTLSSLLPSSPSPLSSETLSKLHKLSALLPPSPADPTTHSHLSGLDELISIVQRIREVDTSSLGLKEGEMVDARIRAEAEPIDLARKGRNKEELEVEGERLLECAEKREGGYFVAQMPENVRRRKSRSAVPNVLMLIVDKSAQRIVEIKDSLDLFKTYATLRSILALEMNQVKHGRPSRLPELRALTES